MDFYEPQPGEILHTEFDGLVPFNHLATGGACSPPYHPSDKPDAVRQYIVTGERTDNFLLTMNYPTQECVPAPETMTDEERAGSISGALIWGTAELTSSSDSPSSPAAPAYFDLVAGDLAVCGYYYYTPYNGEVPWQWEFEIQHVHNYEYHENFETTWLDWMGGVFWNLLEAYQYQSPPAFLLPAYNLFWRREPSAVYLSDHPPGTYTYDPPHPDDSYCGFYQHPTLTFSVRSPLCGLFEFNAEKYAAMNRKKGAIPSPALLVPLLDPVTTSLLLLMGSVLRAGDNDSRRRKRRAGQ